MTVNDRYNYIAVLEAINKLPNRGLSNKDLHEQHEYPPFGCTYRCMACYLLKVMQDEGIS